MDLIQLPKDIINEILSYLDLVSLLEICNISKVIYFIGKKLIDKIKEKYSWRKIDTNSWIIKKSASDLILYDSVILINFL